MTESDAKGRGFRRLMIVPAVFGLCAALLSSCATQPEKTVVAKAEGRSGAIARSESSIAVQMKKLGIAGLSIAVADKGGTFWTRGFGKADKGGRPFDASTVTNVGSVSKVFTATAIMRLVEEGLVDLDAPVSRYLPGFSPKTWGPDPAGVTVRAVLCHESGLQSDVLEGFEPGGGISDQEDPRPYADNAALASATTLCFEPYTAFSYSNLGYSLLGLVVEAASGMGFPDYVEKNILAPLGMASSSFAYRADLADRYAKGPAGRNWVGIPAIRDMPAGSLNASAEDMGRFLTAVMRTVKDNAGPGDGGILDPPSLAEMWTRQNAKARFDFDFQVGLGWWPVTMDLLPGTVLYGHGGDLPPFHCLLLVEPKAGIGIAIMVNSAGNLGSFSLAPIADEILRSFAMAEKGVTYPEPDRKPKPATALPEELAKRLEGNWVSPNGALRVKRAGKGMKVFLFGNWMDADYRPDDSFGLSAHILGIKLPLSILDEISLSVESRDGADHLALRARGIILGVAEKAVEADVDPAWLARSGTWTPIGPAAKERRDLYIMKLVVGRDKVTGLFGMTVDMAGQKSSYPAASRGARELYLLGHGRNLGSTVTAIERDGEEMLEVYGITFKKANR